MSHQSTPLMSVTVRLAGACARGRLVNYQKKQAVPGEICLGVATSDGETGKLLQVTVLGSTPVETGGTFSEGDPLTADINGRVVLYTGDGYCVGRAMNSSVVSGQFVEMLLNTTAQENSVSVKKGVTGVLESSAGGIKITKQQIVCKSSCTLLGDSLNNYGVFAPNLVSGEAPGSGIGTFSNHPVTWANDVLSMYGMQIDVISNRAVAGSTLDALSGQIDGALTDGTDIAWVHSGINTLTTTNDVPSVIASKINTAVARLSAAKTLVIWDSIDPAAQPYARAHLAISINAMARAICERYQNVLFNDTFAALIDPASALLYAKTGLLQSSDNIHKTTSGAQVAGYSLAQLLLSKVVIVPYMTVGPNLCPVFWASGANAGTTTPGTGTIDNTANAIPTGWNVQVFSGSAAVVTSSSGSENLRLTITNSGGADSSVYVQRIDTAGLASLFSGGDIVRGSWMAAVKGQTNLKRIATLLRATGNIITWGGGESGSESAPVYPAVAFSGRRSTIQLKLPTPISALEMIFAIKVGATTGAVTVDLSLPEINRLT